MQEKLKIGRQNVWKKDAPSVQYKAVAKSCALTVYHTCIQTYAHA